jgi:hypothetical protein
MRSLTHRCIFGALLLAATTVGMAMPVDSSKGSDSQEARPVKSTQTAVLASLILPGLGQAYTENYWKIPLFTGTAAVSAVLFFQNNSQFSTASNEYDKALADGTNAATVNLLLRRREVYRDNRDMSAVVFLITYALAAVDAYVGAELYSFDTGEKLSMNLGPTPSQSMALSLRMTW